jgi:hypothetical protein
MKNTPSRKDWAKKQIIDKAVKETDQMDKARKAPGTNSLVCYVLLLGAIVSMRKFVLLIILIVFFS